MRDAAFSARNHLLLAVVAIGLLVLGFGSWVALARIAGAVIATGALEVAQQHQVVQHPDGGVVEAILVAEGDAVSAGSVLMRLDGTQLRSELAIVETRLFELLARRARLEAERDGAAQPVFEDMLMAAATRHDPGAQIRAQMAAQVRLLAARRETTARLIAQLEQRQVQIDAQKNGISAQLAALERQLSLLAEERAAQRSLLERGLTQAALVLALDREAARLEGNHGALLAERAVAAERHAEIGQQILSLSAQRQEEAQLELRETTAQELELAERHRALSTRIARLELRAPVAGIVHGLQFTTPLAVLRAAEPALHIVPRDRPPIIAARIAPADIDQVAPGQSATLYLPALDMRDMPQLMAEVIHVSADTFTDTRDGTRFYRVELAFLDESLAHLPAQVLLPGMPVEVFLQTVTQSPWRYLTRPLTSYFSRALRES